MTRTLLYVLAALAGLIAALSLGPAHAGFYSLEGRFQCLDKVDASCVDMRHVEQKPDPPPEDSLDAVPDPTPDPLLHAPAALVGAEQDQGAQSSDPIIAIAARIEAGKPTRDDMRRLRALSRTGNGRAIELLAWCDYAGIGLPRDPIAAYLLYGIAALAGVPTASANQVVIYEYVLTQDQRQMVLDIQNDDIDPRPTP